MNKYQFAYLNMEIKALESERDELLAVLKEAREALRKTHEANGGVGYQWSVAAMERADETIAKADNK